MSGEKEIRANWADVAERALGSYADAYTWLSPLQYLPTLPDGERGIIKEARDIIERLVRSEVGRREWFAAVESSYEPFKRIIDECKEIATDRSDDEVQA